MIKEAVQRYWLCTKTLERYLVESSEVSLTRKGYDFSKCEEIDEEEYNKIDKESIKCKK